MRIKGDQDKSSEMQALTAKLIGKSAFGSCITNKDKHRTVKLKTITSTDVIGDVEMMGDTTATKEHIASINAFMSYECLMPNMLEVTTRKLNTLYDQLHPVAKVIFDEAKLSVLRFFYDFLKRILIPENYELMETDTDSIYIALKEEKFEDNIQKDKYSLYESIKKDFFIVPGHRFGKRIPNRYKEEFKGSSMVSLCSKMYCVFDEVSQKAKFSCKGVQQRNLTSQPDSGKPQGNAIISIYKSALTSRTESSKTMTATNRGIRQKNGQMFAFEQQKTMLNSLYIKRKVLDDGIHTVPLDI